MAAKKICRYFIKVEIDKSGDVPCVGTVTAYLMEKGLKVEVGQEHGQEAFKTVFEQCRDSIEDHGERGQMHEWATAVGGDYMTLRSRPFERFSYERKATC